MMSLPTFREIREVQSSCDANAYLQADWLLIECQARQATDAQGTDGYIVYVVASTDHSWDPFAEEAEEERYKRALAVVESFAAKHGIERAEAISASERLRRRGTLQNVLLKNSAPSVAAPAEKSPEEQ